MNIESKLIEWRNIFAWYGLQHRAEEVSELLEMIRKQEEDK